jgi:hypothetical protein
MSELVKPGPLETLEIVAYCVGDFVAKDQYEVVTAWVDTRHRGLELAVKVIVSDDAHLLMTIGSNTSKCL